MKLLKTKPSQRLTANDALAHEWFNDSLARENSNGNITENLEKIAQNMRSFNARRKFQRAVRLLCSTIRWRRYLQTYRSEQELSVSGGSPITGGSSSSSSSSSSIGGGGGGGNKRKSTENSSPSKKKRK